MILEEKMFHAISDTKLLLINTLNNETMKTAK
jgi:hypothetical protein